MSPSDGGLGPDYSWSSASGAAFEVLDSGQTTPEGIYLTPSQPNPFIQPHLHQAQPQSSGNYGQYNGQPEYSTTFDIPSFRPNDLPFPMFSQQIGDFKSLEKVQPQHFKQTIKSTSNLDKRPTKKRRLQTEPNSESDEPKKPKKNPTPQLTLIQFDQVPFLSSYTPVFTDFIQGL